MRKITILVVAFFFSAILTLCCVEGVLRLIGFPSEIPPVRAGWKGDAVASETNEFGFRGQHIKYSPSDSVVILLGDSQVEAAAQSKDSMPEKLLEKKLEKKTGKKYTVFSLGAAGYGIDQEYFALEEYFTKKKAHLVVLWFTPENDFWNTLFPTHFPKDGWIKPTFRIEKNKLTGPNYFPNEKLWDEQYYLSRLWHRVFLPSSGMDACWEQYLPPAYVGSAKPIYAVSDSWQQNPFKEMENPTTEKSHYAIDFIPVSQRMDYAVRLTSFLLKKIDSLCAANGAVLKIIAVYPKDKWDKAQTITSHQWNGLWYHCSYGQRIKTMEKCMAGLAYFPIVLDTYPYQVSPSDIHLNTKANMEVMENMKDIILSAER